MKTKKKLTYEEAIIQVLTDNHIYNINYKYDIESCTCHEDICRCRNIINTRIEDSYIDLTPISDKISKYILDGIEMYCIDRLLRICKVYDPNNWNIETRMGYYGGEVSSIKLDDKVVQEVMAAARELHDIKKNFKKILYVLVQEYGYLLDSLKDISDASIDKVNLSDILIGQSEHYKQLDREVIKSYYDHTLPIAICIAMCDDKYKLIDGYHRIAAAIQQKKRKIKIIIIN